MNKKLTILVVNWTWYPSGGDWTYVENLCTFYEAKGHKVIPFSMTNEKDFATPYAEYFISKIDYKELNKNKSIFNGVKAVKNTIYSTEAKDKLKLLLDKHPVDIVHLNNIHHYLTPASIIPEIKKRGIPILWTLHDYVILCPNTTFISNEKICEKCNGGKFYNCITNKCKKQSFSASVVAALESYVNNFTNPYKYVDYFICPSAFIQKKFAQFGFDANRLKQVYNLFDVSTVSIDNMTLPNPETKPYIVYVGNILKVKGIFTLAKAMGNVNIDLCIIGHGEHYNELKELIATENLLNVKLIGKLPKEQVFQYVRHSAFVVVPSEWYENLPYSLVEALLLAKPVLGANIGGIPELVMNDNTGYLFEPGNVDDLRSKIELLLSDKEKLAVMGNNARAYALKMVNYDKFGEQLAGIYSSLQLTL